MYRLRFFFTIGMMVTSCNKAEVQKSGDQIYVASTPPPSPSASPSSTPTVSPSPSASPLVVNECTITSRELELLKNSPEGQRKVPLMGEELQFIVQLTSTDKTGEVIKFNDHLLKDHPTSRPIIMPIYEEKNVEAVVRNKAGEQKTCHIKVSPYPDPWEGKNFSGSRGFCEIIPHSLTAAKDEFFYFTVKLYQSRALAERFRDGKLVASLNIGSVFVHKEGDTTAPIIVSTYDYRYKTPASYDLPKMEIRASVESNVTTDPPGTARRVIGECVNEVEVKVDDDEDT